MPQIQKPWERNWNNSPEPPVLKEKQKQESPAAPVVPWEKDWTQPDTMSIADQQTSAPIDNTRTNFLGGPEGFNQKALDIYLNPVRAFNSEFYKRNADFANTLEQWRRGLEEQIGKDKYIFSVGTEPPAGGEKIAGIGNIVNLTKYKDGIENTQRAFSQSQQAAEKLSKDIDKVIQERGGIDKFTEALSRGLGGATFDLPAISALGLPVFSGLTSGAEAIQYGDNVLKAVALGGAEGTMLHLTFKMLNNIPKIERTALGGALFGAPAVQAELSKDPEERDWSKATADFIVGAGMTFPGPQGKEFRQSFYQNIWEYFTKAEGRATLLEKKALVKKISRDLERDANLNIGVILDRYKRDFAGVVQGVDFSKVKEDITKLSVEAAVRERLSEKNERYGEDVQDAQGNSLAGQLPRPDLPEGAYLYPDLAEAQPKVEGVVNRVKLEIPSDAKRGDKDLRFSHIMPRFRGGEGAFLFDVINTESPDYGSTISLTTALEKGFEIPGDLPSNKITKPLADFGPKGIRSIAMENKDDSLGAWIVENSIGDIERARKYFEDRQAQSSLPVTVENIVKTFEKDRGVKFKTKSDNYEFILVNSARNPGKLQLSIINKTDAGEVEPMKHFTFDTIEEAANFIVDKEGNKQVGPIMGAIGKAKEIELKGEPLIEGEANTLSKLNDFLMTNGPRSDWAKKVARLKSEAERPKSFLPRREVISFESLVDRYSKLLPEKLPNGDPYPKIQLLEKIIMRGFTAVLGDYNKNTSQIRVSKADNIKEFELTLAHEVGHEVVQRFSNKIGGQFIDPREYNPKTGKYESQGIIVNEEGNPDIIAGAKMIQEIWKKPVTSYLRSIKAESPENGYTSSKFIDESVAEMWSILQVGGDLERRLRKLNPEAFKFADEMFKEATHVKQLDEKPWSERAKELQNEAEKVPDLKDFDPLTGKEISIPAELLETSDWIIQDGKRLEKFQKFADRIESALSKGQDIRDGIFKLLSVEDAFRNIGKDTGFNVKNINSVKKVIQDEGLKLIEDISKKINYDERVGRELPFVFEDKTDPRRNSPEFKEAIKLLEDYFEKSFKELQDRGGLTRTWNERILSDLRDELKNATTTEHKLLIRQMIEKVKNTEFEHIPTQIWFEKGLDRDSANRFEIMRNFLSLKSGIKRKSIRLADLVEAGIISKEDLHFRDVIGSYARRLAKDISLLNIREAALKEGLLIKQDPGAKLPKGKENYVSAPFHAPVFYGTKLHPTLHDWVWEISGRPFSSNIISTNIRKGMSLYKMAQFYNPLFLPMYDAVQASMLNRAHWTREVYEAQRDVFKRSADWREAGINGLFSQPYDNLFTDYQKQIIAASKSRTQKIFDAHNLLPNRIISQMYNASWETAWNLDQVMRMSSYRVLKNKGYSSRDAAQLAALFHGDYASVPPRTREMLNHVFFTPTFKIAMAKLNKEMVKGAGNFAFTNKQGGKDLALAKGLASTVGIMIAWDLFMTGYMGFDREEWGWKYKRKVSGTEGEEDYTIGFSGPHNSWLNEITRIKNALSPVNKAPVKAWLNSQVGKIHPLYRTATNLINNENPEAEPEVFYTGRPVPIYKEFDHPANQALDVMKYMVRSMFPISNLFNPNDREEKSRVQLAKETSKLFELVSRPFTFRYTKAPLEKRIIKRIQGLETDLKNQILNFGEQGVGKDQLEDMEAQILELQNLLTDELGKESFQPPKK